MNWILDPKIFNYLILGLFAFAVIRWAIERNWGQAIYWAGALILNLAVTFMEMK
jgi:hypothetical protein